MLAGGSRSFGFPWLKGYPNDGWLMFFYWKTIFKWTICWVTPIFRKPPYPWNDFREQLQETSRHHLSFRIDLRSSCTCSMIPWHQNCEFVYYPSDDIVAIAVNSHKPQSTYRFTNFASTGVWPGMSNGYGSIPITPQVIPFLVGWTSIYQLFWCSPGVQGFDTLPNHEVPFVGPSRSMRGTSRTKFQLVGGWPTPLKNMSSSVGMMTFPIYGKS